MNIPAPPGKEYAPYQLKCIRYAMTGKGTLIADEMGLGKTVEAIGVINAMAAAAVKHLSVLIVCPAGLKLNWARELVAWLAVGIAPEVEIVSYEGLANVKTTTPDLLIVDEAHYIKSSDSQRSKRVAEIAKHAKRILLMTGTPIENRPIELWPLLSIVCPEKWDSNLQIETRPTIAPLARKSHPGQGQAFWAFALRYCDLKKVRFPGRVGLAWDFSGASNLEELSARLRNTCMIRRLKKDVLTELPDKRRQLILLPSSADDRDLFPFVNEQDYHETLSKLKADKVAFEEWSKRRHEQALAKVDASVAFIDDVLDSTAKLIVFAHHSDVVSKLTERIADLLGKEETVVSMTGETPLPLRQWAVDTFQTTPSCRVIVGSIGAMGVGWTLTASDHVIFVELDPVPGHMTQAEDRAHRRGQKRSLLIQHLLSDGSLCARMAKIVVRKQAVINTILDPQPVAAE